jgi:hypothetical protein
MVKEIYIFEINIKINIMEVICLMEKIKCLRKPTRHGNAL